MPLDPFITHGFRAPEPEPYGAAAARTMSLRQMYQGRQADDRAAKLDTLKLEETERGVKAGRRLSELLSQGKTPQEVAAGLNQDGYGTEAAQYSAQTAAAGLASRKEQLEHYKSIHTEISKGLTAVLNAPDPQKQATHTAVRNSLLRSGLIKADDMPEVYDAAFVAAEVAQGMDAEKQIAAAQTALRLDFEKAKYADQAPGVIADSSRKTAEAAQIADLGMTKKDRETLDATLQRDANNVTEAELAWKVANGTPEEKVAAEAALNRLDKSRRDSRPVVNVQGGGTSSGGGDAKDIAAAIIDGSQPPDLKGLYRAGVSVRGELARKGYDLTTAQRDWQAVQRHISTLNGPQQERLRQAVTFTYDSLDIIEDLFKEWKQVAKPGGFKLLNSATLAVAKQLPGRAGEVAQALEAQINDLTSELGTVYKGGNASTDESLRLAAENLKANWNDAQFSRQLENIRKNLRVRKNSILSSQPAGVSENSRYAPPSPAQSSAPPKATHRFNAATGKIEAL